MISTSLSNSSRRLKSCIDSVDRISNLPDSIIGHILSFLPTKDAVATGVLSQRWMFLWTTVSNLDFHYPGGKEKEDKSSVFIQFVNYVMLLHKPGCLNKFSLIWKHKCVPFYVNAWISAAASRNVHQLFVSVSNLLIQVQRSIFNCEGLQSLELNGKTWIFPKIVFSLPKLESLKLVSVYFHCEEDFSKLVAGCPVLKYLDIDMDMWEMLGYHSSSRDDIRDDFGSLRFQVPRGMFSCDSLQSLKLDCNVCIPSEIVVCLPKLESLTLMPLYILSGKTFQELVSGCLMLKYLYIKIDFMQMNDDLDIEDDDISFKYVVFSTTLRHLELYVYDGCGATESSTNPAGRVELHAPSLEYMIVKGITGISIQGSLSFLFEANMRSIGHYDGEEEHSYCNSVVEAVSAFQCVHALTLSGDVIWAVSYATNNLRIKFKRLTKLKVTIGCCYWSSLQDFIRLSSNLEVLVVKKQDTCMSGGHHLKTSNWKKPNQVPKCLSDSLKTVSVNGYDGGDDELAMIGYILNHGSALKVMKICFSESIKDFKTKYEVVQQISEFPRKSSLCKVEFH